MNECFGAAADLLQQTAGIPPLTVCPQPGWGRRPQQGACACNALPRPRLAPIPAQRPPAARLAVHLHSSPVAVMRPVSTLGAGGVCKDVAMCCTMPAMCVHTADVPVAQCCFQLLRHRSCKRGHGSPTNPRPLLLCQTPGTCPPQTHRWNSHTQGVGQRAERGTLAPQDRHPPSPSFTQPIRRIC